MKVRTDFVTNSSSSSFVVAITNDAAHAPIITAILKATDELETDEGKRINTVDELGDFILSFCGHEGITLDNLLVDNEWASRWYHTILPSVQAGKTVIFKYISYDADALTSFLQILAKADAENVEILIDES